MKCYICGGDHAELIYKRGKGKVDVKKVVIGGMLTAGLGGVGAAAGLADLMAQKCYIHCPDCGYDQFSNFQTKNVMDPQQMTQLEVFYEDYGIPLRTIRDQLIREAEGLGVKVRVRLAEFQTHAVSGPAMLPCILIEHPSFAGSYHSFCIAPGRGNQSGDEGFFVFLTGESKQLSKKDYNQNQSATHGGGWTTAAAGLIRGGDWGVGTAIGGVAFEMGHGAAVGARKLLNTLTTNQQALDAEVDWYGQTQALMDAVLGI